MSHFKLVVVRTDGITHSTEISGWHGETLMIKVWRETCDDKRTLCAIWFDGVPQNNSHEVAWHPRNSFNIGDVK